MADIGKDLSLCKSLLTDNEAIGIPTETVYGLAANALQVDAVLNIFQIKNRPTFDPLICHIPSLNHLNLYATDIPKIAFDFANQFWPGPLTLILPKKSIIPDLVTSGLDTCGFRVPNHPLTLDLLNTLNFPLAAPSANPFGYISPTTASHVNDQLGDKIKYILDGGPCGIGLESTIIGFEDGHTVIYRLGGLTIDDIKKIDPNVSLKINSSSNPIAPGQLQSHYSPKKKLVLFDRINDLELLPSIESATIITFSQEVDLGTQNLILSPTISLLEASKNLFNYLRLADDFEGSTIIYAQKVPGQGLGLAINDRLKRAEVKE